VNAGPVAGGDSDEILLRVAGERDAALVIQALKQPPGLDGREVLHLADSHAWMTFLRTPGSENRSQANSSPRAASQIAATAGCWTFRSTEMA